MAKCRASRRGADDIEASDVWPQYRRYNHRPIGLLEVLQNRDDQSGHGAGRGIQRVHKLGRGGLLGALLAALPGGGAVCVGALLLLPNTRPALPRTPFMQCSSYLARHAPVVAGRLAKLIPSLRQKSCCRLETSNKRLRTLLPEYQGAVFRIPSPKHGDNEPDLLFGWGGEVKKWKIITIRKMTFINMF